MSSICIDMTITIKNKINIVIDRVSPLWDTFITLSYDGKSYTKDTDSSGNFNHGSLSS